MIFLQQFYKALFIAAIYYGLVAALNCLLCSTACHQHAIFDATDVFLQFFIESLQKKKKKTISILWLPHFCLCCNKHLLFGSRTTAYTFTRKIDKKINKAFATFSNNNFVFVVVLEHLLPRFKIFCNYLTVNVCVLVLLNSLHINHNWAPANALSND